MNDKIEPEEQPVSKTRRKKDAQALQKLGTDLLDVPESAWKELALPDSLTAALLETKRIHSRSGRKQQLQYIGKLMRDIDPGPIAAWFERRRIHGRTMARRHHELEAWRDRLVAEGDEAIEQYLLQQDADRQHLRQLVRQARREQQQNKPPKASRALFRYLRDIQNQTTD